MAGVTMPAGCLSVGGLSCAGSTRQLAHLSQPISTAFSPAFSTQRARSSITEEQPAPSTPQGSRHMFWRRGGKTLTSATSYDQGVPVLQDHVRGGQADSASAVLGGPLPDLPSMRLLSFAQSLWALTAPFFGGSSVRTYLMLLVWENYFNGWRTELPALCMGYQHSID